MKCHMTFIALMLALFTASAQARVYEYQFNDTAGKTISVTETSGLTNPKGPVRAVIISGFDLKVS